MEVLVSSTNRFAGAVVDPESLPVQAETFRQRLCHSLDAWTSQGLKVVWLEIPIEKSALIPVAVEAARDQWRAVTGAGCKAQYWSQESGTWEMKAES